ncbi:hypothetical protein HYFRA_00010527 [Hymenoscyphus fraxineus]|uniref:2EXR domain-containing protein n=1 Tax=Hymenoscyphus fraxineus TaxID=746836 RepID=A0A9N9L4P7_9HELO|nr:hypothetical protein HYFRA_00010527 [Hymenoscyphus fraxineus]
MALVSLVKMQNDIMDFIDMKVLGKGSAQMPAYGPRARFTYFTRLPKELRLKIWSFATPPGTIIKAKNELYIGEKLNYPLSHKDELWTWSASETTSYNRRIPSLLHTCKESREEYLHCDSITRHHPTYLILVGPNSTGTEIRQFFFSYELDTVYLHDLISYSTTERFRRPLFENLQNILIEYHYVVSLLHPHQEHFLGAFQMLRKLGLYDYYGKRPLDVLIGILQSVYKKYDTLIQIHKQATEHLRPARQPLEIYWVTTYRIPTYGPKMLDAFQNGCACIHLASIPECINSITTRFRGAVQWVLQASRKSAELVSSKSVSET